MDTGYSNDACSIRSRRDDPIQSVRPLGTSSSFNGAVLEKSRQSIEVGQTEEDKHSCVYERRQLGNPGQKNASSCQQRTVPEAKKLMGELGESESTDDESLHPEILKSLRLSFASTVRLLNQSGFGQVISERQLYRHRKRSDERFVVESKVDLLQYCAWLHFRRHSRSYYRLTSKGSYQQSNVNAITRCQTSDLKKGESQVNAGSILELIQMQSECCALTGWKLIATEAALDHIIPISRGGTHEITNAQVLHKSVNRCKGTLTNEEFISICEAVVNHVSKQGKPK